MLTPQKNLANVRGLLPSTRAHTIRVRRTREGGREGSKQKGGNEFKKEDVHRLERGLNIRFEKVDCQKAPFEKMRRRKNRTTNKKREGAQFSFSRPTSSSSTAGSAKRGAH